MTAPIEIKQEGTFNFILVLALFTSSAFWISQSILISGGIGLLICIIFLFIRKQSIVFTEIHIQRSKLFNRQDVYEYNQLLQLKVMKLYYTNFARFTFHFTFKIDGKEIKLKYFMDRYSLGKQIIKLLKEKNVKIVYDDEIIEKALMQEQ